MEDKLLKVAQTYMKMNTMGRIVLSIALLIFLSGCILISSLSWRLYSDYTAYMREDERILAEVADKIGIPHDWVSIREYVYCEIPQKGKTRTQILAELHEIGEFRDYGGEDFDDQIDFDDPHLHSNLSPLIIWYKDDGSYGGVSVGETNFGPRSSCEMPPTATPVVDQE